MSSNAVPPNERARWGGRSRGKTGTTNEAKDTWFVGYSTDIAAAVWVGYDEPLPLGWGDSGCGHGVARLDELHEGGQ